MNGRGQAAVVQAEHLVDGARRDRAVGDQQDGAAGDRGQQVPGQLAGGFLVQVLGGLVEYHHGEVGEQHAGQGEALPLPAGQPGAVLADRGRQAARQGVGPG